MPPYAFAFRDHGVYSPDGPLPHLQPSDVDAYNRALEQQEIAWLQTAPEHVFLYVHLPATTTPTGTASGPPPVCCRVAVKQGATVCPVCQSTAAMMATRVDAADIRTFLGTSVATHIDVGPRRQVGFGWHTYRRHVRCRLYGVLYYGWYFESTGDYCRLRKAKRQPAPGKR